MPFVIVLSKCGKMSELTKKYQQGKIEAINLMGTGTLLEYVEKLKDLQVIKMQIAVMCTTK